MLPSCSRLTACGPRYTQSAQSIFPKEAEFIMEFSLRTSGACSRKKFLTLSKVLPAPAVNQKRSCLKVSDLFQMQYVILCVWYWTSWRWDQWTPQAWRRKRVNKKTSKWEMENSVLHPEGLMMICYISGTGFLLPGGTDGETRGRNWGKKNKNFHPSFKLWWRGMCEEYSTCSYKNKRQT